MSKLSFTCVITVLFVFANSVIFAQTDDWAILSTSNLSVSILLSTPVEEELPLVLVEETASEAVKNEPAADDELLHMQTAIADFFKAMEGGKIDALKASCTDQVVFKTHLQDQMGNHHILDEKINDLIPFVAQSGNAFQINVQFELLPPDPSTMQFRAPYRFFINNDISHCGVCTFDLEKTGDEWKIKMMIDTRSRTCN